MIRFATYSDGKHGLIFDAWQSSTPISHHEVMISYCIEDDTFFGEQICASGWLDLDEDEVSEYIEELGLAKIVREIMRNIRIVVRTGIVLRSL